MTKSESLPTYAQIAKKARVSTKTVCNVFRTPDIVRSKTAQKVLVALKELGVENPTVMSERLRPAGQRATQSIMFLEAGMPLGSLHAPVYAKIIQAAELRAHELGWQLSLRHKQNEETLKEALRNFQGGGIILFGKSVVYAELQSVIPGIPAVRLLAPPANGLDCDNVDYDRLEMPRMAARELHSKGCQRVAYIGPDDTRADLFLEEAGRLKVAVTDCRQDDVFTTRKSAQIVNREALEVAFKKIMHWKPDGLFVHSDDITNSLYPLLAKNHIKPGKDLQIVSCNADEIFLMPLHPRPSSIDIHPWEIGRRGVDQLLWRIENKDAPPSTIIIRPKLVPGEEV